MDGYEEDGRILVELQARMRLQLERSYFPPTCEYAVKQCRIIGIGA